ncbi:hypothetical protein PR202_gb21313 [Eleusine coracana subsp. coracana]|uniref:Uncharacterized protein n=1 Tax=Eleusine coracana subsp. coracana TaxID=191504 RepID=A0AAV5FEF8_ELECO|nr:hypothetical protein PR202_gb21313 [Eleusine coracana subsp. coracana]
MDSRPAPQADGEAVAEVEIIKPRNDKRGYRRVVLPNALECLLVSDPDTDKAAASMSVSVGYFCDPDGLEGLAHFLEHMLFYASEKYPVEDSYSKYIAEKEECLTIVQYAVNSYCCCFLMFVTRRLQRISGNISRFAQFFIKPLMSPDATLREIKAVDSENQKNLLSDPWRMSQLQKHLCSEQHPYHKFSTGNWDTLEVKAKEKGLDTRLELLKFYDSHYSANLMYLVVYGKESLDSLQNLVENKFADIRNVGRKPFSFPGHPCTSEHLQILVKAVPIKQGHTLRILWPITPNVRHYKEGPCIYITLLQTSGAPKWIFDEIFPPEDWLIASSVPSKFSPDAIQKILNELTPENVSSPESAVLTDLFTRLLMDYLNDYAYDAEVAGLYYSVKPNDTGFQVTMVGYNDKMRTLLETVIGKIAEFEVKSDRFSVIKEIMTKEYENFKFRQPYQQALYYCSLILEEQTWPWDEELAALSHLEASDLGKFLPHLLTKTFIECYFAGNIEPIEAKSVLQHIEEVLFNAPNSACKPLSPSQHLAKRIVKLEKGLRFYYPAMCLNHQDENSSLLHYIQTHQDNVKQNVLLQLLALVGKQPAFHQLRSVEQLGYIALLRQRVESFLKMFETTLYEMPDAEFKVAALRELKKEELIEFFNNHVKVDAPQKKVLSIQVYGGLHSAEYQKIVDDAPPPPWCEITDIYSFRRSRPLYGSFKGGVGQMKL